MKNKNIVSKLFALVLFSFIGIILCEDCNALENKNIQTIDSVTLPTNRLVISKEDATQVDI